jgi:hypothetical protein
MTSNGKNLNYKVIDIIKSYSFHIKFTSIRVQPKNYKILKTDWTHTAVAGATVPRGYVTPWGTTVGPCRRPPRRKMYSFANFLRTVYFCKIEEKM